MAMPSELTDKERRFVKAICDGADIQDAMDLAGFASGTGYGAQLLRRPLVVAAIDSELRFRIASKGAVAAVDRMVKTASGQATSTGPQVDAAKFLAGLAGYVAPKAADVRDVGDVLADVSLDELRAIIDKREASAAQRAKPVDATVLTIEDDKLLNLLD
jgi:hypothetical protein